MTFAPVSETNDISFIMANPLQQFAERVKRDIESKIRTARAMNGIRLSVGINPAAHYPNGKSVAEVAELVEYGTRRMPPRPFMRVAKAENEAAWRGRLRRAVDKSLKTGQPLDSLLEPIAQKMKEDVQESIMNFGAYDTGRLHNSVIASVTKGV